MSPEDMESTLVCAGCGQASVDDQPLHVSCTRQGLDDTDHVLRAHIPATSVAAAWPNDEAEDNPFLRYRRLSHTWRLAMRRGLSDATYVGIVEKLEASIHEVDNVFLRTTPMLHSDELSVSIKDETGNVSGSHKSRHLIGTALHLEVAKALGAPIHDSILAIASCGNAALAAAVIARATGQPLQVFVPPWADSTITERLSELGAQQIVCERRDSDEPGDPCYLRFREAVDSGALPYSCQGTDNALAIIGGHSLGWELVESARQSTTPWDNVIIQVGGGALASSIIQTFLLAKQASLLATLPRFHVVQTESAFPLVRAWLKMQSLGVSLEEVRPHRSQYMWPWETEPTSIANGILDDETYDWFAIVEGIEASDGSALCVSETRLRDAQRTAQDTTGIAVSVTGASGLAGLMELRDSGEISADEHSVVLFTGAIR